MEVFEEDDLYNYCFSWGDNYEHTAIALGYGSLYNHSYTPNAIFTNNIDNCQSTFMQLLTLMMAKKSLSITMKILKINHHYGLML